MNVQLKRKREEVVENTSTKLHIHRPKFEDDEAVLLEHCFDRMLPHVWYKIIPSSDSDVENIAFAMGQSWILIQSLLYSLKYMIKFDKTLRLNLDKWRDVDNRLPKLSSSKLNFSSTHICNQKKIYYLCKDTPLYRSPTVQIENKYYQAKLRYNDKADRDLTRILQSKYEASLLKGVTISSAENTTLGNEINPFPSTEAASPTVTKNYETVSQKLEK